MRIEAPISIEFVWLNDWRYWYGLHAWQTALIHIEVGWPPVIIFKVFGIGFRFQIESYR